MKIILLLSAIFLAVAIPVAIAVIGVWSPSVDVTVTEYELTINDPPDGTTLDTYTFTGILTLDGVPVQNELVTLHVNNVATAFTDTTDVNGAYTIIWSTLVAGTYSFKTYA